MNRDTPPPPMTAINQTRMLVNMAVSAGANGDIPLQLPAATDAIRALLGTQWPHTTPEAARDALAQAAILASGAGAGPAYAAAYAAAGDTDAAMHAWALLELAADGSRARSLASSLAFDRDEDETTLTTLAVLLAIAICPPGDHHG